MKIYTKGGDKGQTSLHSGTRVSKADDRIHGVGLVDHACCAIGDVLAHWPMKEGQLSQLMVRLRDTQHCLFRLGATMATPGAMMGDAEKGPHFNASHVRHLESWIDDMEEELPLLRNFILPGGHPAGSKLHLARAVCRNAERAVAPLAEAEKCPGVLLQYLNRLSDFLFVAARFVNQVMQKPELIHKS